MKNNKVWLVVMLLIVFIPGICFSQGYPNRQIELVIPFSPGGTVDLAGRILSGELAKELAVPVVVSNKSGASGAVAAEYVINAKPDGYTLLAATGTVLISLPQTVPGITYKWTDFTPVIRFCSAPYLLSTRMESPFNSMADVAAFAKENPGKLNCGSVGVASMGNVNFELWRDKAGVDIGYIPYKGGADTNAAMLGGHLDFASSNLSPIYGLVKSGKFKILATSSKLKEYPQVPTFAEIGFPEAAVFIWIAIMAPAKTPSEIVDKFIKSVEKVTTSPATAEKFVNLGFDIEAIKGKDLATGIERENQAFGKIAEKMRKAVQGN